MSHSAGSSSVSRKPKSMLLQATEFSYLGIFFGVAICVGYWGGAYLDRRLGWQGRLSVVGVLLGIVTGFRELWRMAARYQRSLNQEAGSHEQSAGAPGGQPPGGD